MRTYAKALVLLAVVLSSIQAVAQEDLIVEGAAAQKLWTYIGIGSEEVDYQNARWWGKESTDIDCFVRANGQGACQFSETHTRYGGHETERHDLIDDSDSTYALTTFRILKEAGLRPDARGHVRAARVQMLNSMGPGDSWGRSYVAIITP